MYFGGSCRMGKGTAVHGAIADYPARRKGQQFYDNNLLFSVLTADVKENFRGFSIKIKADQ
ncbi:MAG: hypothetical protein KGM95_05495 [Betaproteobacteria bacterium]|nr:hypothetical protein [Betaproteobacteria bacterium]